MIRLLGEPDRGKVMDLLVPESTVNLFVIGDIENFGFDSDFQQVWGDFDSPGNLRAVLLRYHGSFISYSPGDFDVDGLAEVVRRQRERLSAFSGLDRVMCRFEARAADLLSQAFRKRTLFFLELKSGERLTALKRELPYELARAVPDDAPAMLDLWRETDGFRASRDGEQALRLELERGSGRAYVVRDGRRVVATARTTAENSRSAMVTAVVTHPDYRRRGLATQLLVRLCGELLAESKLPCLLYDNPEAGSIYRRLGFTDVGTWVLYEFRALGRA
ncbi:MAG: GNAT family N-acetyltransferase [Firmicutes bacterium]|nr:GNAT family N-acetyltransferase [Bacillota bacterium]